MILTFLFFMGVFALVGIASIFSSRGTKQDYYLASSSVAPSLVGLSAVATNNSGFMFIGVIGYTYVTGLASIWLMLGWIAGDFLSSVFVHGRLRLATQASGEASFAGVLSRWNGGQGRLLQAVIGGISLLFMLAYASAQLVAGGKALHVLFDWPTWSGAVIGAALLWALLNTQSVFSLVVMAWSGLASAFAPLLIVLVFGGKPGTRASLAAVLSGLVVAIAWRHAGWHNAIYEGMPGILAGLVVLSPHLLGSLKSRLAKQI